MKTRQGFVSNSSSSSFVVIMKNGEKLTKQKLLEILDVSEKSPLYGFAKDLTKFILGEVKLQTIIDLYDDYYGGEKKSVDEMIADLADNYSRFDKKTLDKINSKEYLCYMGSVSNEDDAMGAFLYDNGLDVNTKDIKIYIDN